MFFISYCNDELIKIGMKKDILEIILDKHNSKWEEVFSHILEILHNAYDDFEEEGIFNKSSSWGEWFSFEIVKRKKKIHYFLLCPKQYTKFISNQIFAQYPNVEITPAKNYLKKIADQNILVWVVTQENSKNSLNTTLWKIDFHSSLTSALSKSDTQSYNSFQVIFSPTRNSDNSSKKQWSALWIMKNVIILPCIFTINIYNFLAGKKIIQTKKKTPTNSDPDELKTKETKKFQVNMNLIYSWDDMVEWKMLIKEIASTFPESAWMKLKGITQNQKKIESIKNRSLAHNHSYYLSSKELSQFIYLPVSSSHNSQMNVVESRSLAPPSNLPLVPDSVRTTGLLSLQDELTPLWATNFRWEHTEFAIELEDRKRHMYIIGKTGMWKSTLLENMIIDDMRKGRGLAVIDPHGDLAEAVIGFIPKSRTNQTIIFDPSDRESPIAFNMLEWVSVEQRPLVASGLVWIFKKIFGSSWWPRLEHILRNTILALIEYPDTTLISIPLMLTNEVYRSKVVKKITDPVVKNFWTQEYAKMNPSQKSEAAWPILNKVGQFLSSTILRNILGQSKNTFNIRWAMDNKKIIIINLSKWKIWEDASALLGAMMVTKFQMDAMSRADIPEGKRTDFYLYVDEFQNFATDSFATILSEARKYKLNLVMANQYIDQMNREIRDAIFGNVWSLISFQVWHRDAKVLMWIYGWNITEDDLMNIKKYNIYAKILVDWMPTNVFSATTFAPNKKNEQVFASRYEKILQVSREKYSKPRKKVEKTINSMLQKIHADDQEWQERKKGNKKR